MSTDREQRVVVLSAVRTGFGSFGGTLRDHSATDLGVIAAQCALARSGVSPADIGHVVFGNVIQSSTDAAYLARHIGLRAGLPIEVPAVTVNRLCGSGFEAIIQGAHRILLGEANAVVAGGAESMSQAPYVSGVPVGAPAGSLRRWKTASGIRSGTPNASFDGRHRGKPGANGTASPGLTPMRMPSPASSARRPRGTPGPFATR